VTGSPGALSLRDDCFQNASLDVDITVERASAPAVKIRALPSRRFVRFALLTDASATLPVQAPVAIRAENTSASEGPTTNSMITQDSPCLPIRTFELPALRNQLSYQVDPPSYFTTQTTSFRNVRGYLYVVCTNMGDGSSPVNWNIPVAAFSPLVGAERTPFPVAIDSAFSPGPALAAR